MCLINIRALALLPTRGQSEAVQERPFPRQVRQRSGDWRHFAKACYMMCLLWLLCPSKYQDCYKQLSENIGSSCWTAQQLHHGSFIDFRAITCSQKSRASQNFQLPDSLQHSKQAVCPNKIQRRSFPKMQNMGLVPADSIPADKKSDWWSDLRSWPSWPCGAWITQQTSKPEDRQIRTPVITHWTCSFKCFSLRVRSETQNSGTSWKSQVEQFQASDVLASGWQQVWRKNYGPPGRHRRPSNPRNKSGKSQVAA